LPNTKQATASSPWAWIKAWIFALVHASTVSLVLGGITFFEDLAKASDEIQSTGTVTFPKRLLPGPLSVPTSQKRLVQPSDDSLSNARHPGDEFQHKATGDELDDPDQPSVLSDTAGWEVVDLVNEAGVEGLD
jgi:hypothetical protein